MAKKIIKDKNLALQSVRLNFIDRAFEYIAPIKAAERFKARQTLALANAYTGASRSRRSMSEWTTGGGDADSDTLYDLPMLRQRSRDLIRNNCISLGAVSTVCTNVVGTGIKLQSRIDRKFLNLADDVADEWEANVEREFSLWADTPECDAARTLNFDSIQELLFRSVLENGDAFVLMPYIDRPTCPYSLKLQLVEADRITNKDDIRDTQFLSGGIKKDLYGAPLEYHVLTTHPGNAPTIGKKEWTILPAFGSKTGRRNVLHLFRSLRIGQSRGVPYLAPVIETIKQLGTYSEAEAMAAVISSMFTVFVKTPDGDAELAGMEPGIGNTSDADYKMGAGAIIGLAEGEDITIANPGRPNIAFDPFVQALMRQIGVALELPFEVLIKHFTASYSAARAALLEAWRFFMARRAWLSKNFCQHVYEAWLTEAVALGRINAPGFLSDDPAIRAAYLSCEWIGPAAGQIDPLKEIQAAKERVDLGVSTLSRETSALTGEDWETTHTQRVKEVKLRNQDGLTQAANNNGAINYNDATNLPND
jgi:lambda family phage portal protein